MEPKKQTSSYHHSLQPPGLAQIINLINEGPWVLDVRNVQYTIELQAARATRTENARQTATLPGTLKSAAILRTSKALGKQDFACFSHPCNARWPAYHTHISYAKTNRLQFVSDLSARVPDSTTTQKSKIDFDICAKPYMNKPPKGEQEAKCNIMPVRRGKTRIGGLSK